MPYSPDSLQGRMQRIHQAYRELRGDAESYIDEIFDSYVIISGDGKYFRRSYELGEGDAVTFGDPEEVQVEYATVTEACEALNPVGRKWELRVIREGVSKRGWIYTQKALESLLPFLENAKIRAVQTASGVFAHQGKELGQVGVLHNARAAEADGFYEPRAEAEILEGKREWLLKALESGDVGGVSINAPCEAVRLPNGQTWVKRFTGFESLDLATIPSAGGAFLRATEALGGEVMDKDKIIELLRKRRPDLAKKLGDDCTLEQAQEALDEALAPVQGPSDEGTMTAQEAQEWRDELQAARVERSEAHLDRRLAEEELPKPVKDKVRKQFAGKVFAREALDEWITSEKEMLDALRQSGQVTGAGETRVEVTQEAVDKVYVALDRTFGVKVEGHEEIRPWRSLRQAYVQITGDGEITGKLPKQHLRAQEAIVTADFPNLLARTMNRRLVQDYNEFNYSEDRLISMRGSASDFKPQEANRVGYYGDPPVVNPETEDYGEAAKPGEESVTYQIQTRGEIITITRRTIINDDLAGIVRRIRGRGRAYRRGFARFCWSFYLTNATYDGDSTAWFTGGHGNLKSEALAAAEIADAVTKIMAFTEPNSGEKIGLDGAMRRRLTLVVGDALWDDAKQINERQYLDDSFTPNPVYRLFGENNERIVVNPLETDATDWGVLSDPMDREILEVKFLNFQEEPEMFLADNPLVGEMFRGDKLQFKDRFEYGGDLVDFRNGVKSVVAG